MTSAFFGGFADTLLKERQAADAERRESDAYKKKQQILLDFQRNEKPDYQAKVWRVYDGNGKEIYTRPMTPSELEDHDLGSRKTKAEVRGAEVNADNSELTYSLNKQYGAKKAELGIQADEEQIETSRHTRQNQDARLQLDRNQDAREAQIQAKNLEQAGKLTSPANFADVYELASDQLSDTISLGGRLAGQQMRTAIQTVIATNPKLTNKQAAAIVVNNMRAKFGAATMETQAEIKARSRASGAALGD